MAKFINPFKAQKSVFGKLELIADIASLSKAGRMKYDEHIKQYRDTLVVMSTQRTEGKAEGLAEEKIEVVSKIVCAADSFFGHPRVLRLTATFPFLFVMVNVFFILIA